MPQVQKVPAIRPSAALDSGENRRDTYKCAKIVKFAGFAQVDRSRCSHSFSVQ